MKLTLAQRIRRWRAHRRWRKSFGFYARSAYLETPDLITNPAGIRLGWGASIRAHARLECIEHEGKLGRIEIGEGTVANLYFHCAAADRVTIAEEVLIAGRVYITDHDHEMPWQTGRVVARPVTIGKGCWLGEGCVVLKGVELGEGCVVGANAVVTKSFPAGSVVGGVPARLLRRAAPDAKPPGGS